MYSQQFVIVSIPTRPMTQAQEEIAMNAHKDAIHSLKSIIISQDCATTDHNVNAIKKNKFDCILFNIDLYMF